VRSCSDVHNFLVEKDVPHEVIHLSALCKTAKAAAEQLGVPLREVIKSLVFLLDGRPTLVLVPGDRVADPQLLRDVTGCERAVLAKGKQVLDITGYRAGAVPPCGLESPLPVVADTAMFQPEVIYCGGGTTATMLKVRSHDLRKMLDPLVAEVTRPPAGEDG
jgi:prolyl-tRNA editing enzyme YbaK/EbsC (Cys-tRNA(Pro) deacylase)